MPMPDLRPSVVARRGSAPLLPAALLSLAVHAGVLALVISYWGDGTRKAPAVIAVTLVSASDFDMPSAASHSGAPHAHPVGQAEDKGEPGTASAGRTPSPLPSTPMAMSYFQPLVPLPPVDDVVIEQTDIARVAQAETPVVAQTEVRSSTNLSEEPPIPLARPAAPQVPATLEPQNRRQRERPMTTSEPKNARLPAPIDVYRAVAPEPVGSTAATNLAGMFEGQSEGIDASAAPRVDVAHANNRIGHSDASALSANLGDLPARKSDIAPQYTIGGLSNPAPRYPFAARRRGQEGRVVLLVHVDAAGHADDVSVRQSSGHGLLDDAAVKTVETWRFVPARSGETPVVGTVEVPISFRLTD